jgi:hypothetical protein
LFALCPNTQSMNAWAEGFLHITDPKGADHMLFLLAVAAGYTLRSWKMLFCLATGFTLGHSITLILAAYDVIRFSSDWVEWTILASIFVTALVHWFMPVNQPLRILLPIIALFGLVHGMGFSSYFRMMYSDDSLAGRLLAFNIGVECGQLLVLLVLLIVNTAAVEVLKIKTLVVKRIGLVLAMSAAFWLLVSAMLFET